MDFTTWQFGSSAGDHRSTNHPINQSSNQPINQSTDRSKPSWAAEYLEIIQGNPRDFLLSQPTISSFPLPARSLPLIVKALPTTLYCSLHPLPFTFTLRCLIHNCTKKNVQPRTSLSPVLFYIYDFIKVFIKSAKLRKLEGLKKKKHLRVCLFFQITSFTFKRWQENSIDIRINLSVSDYLFNGGSDSTRTHPRCFDSFLVHVDGVQCSWNLIQGLH